MPLRVWSLYACLEDSIMISSNNVVATGAYDPYNKQTNPADIAESSIGGISEKLQVF